MFKFIKFKRHNRSRLPLFIALGFLILIGPSIYLYNKFASPAKADWFDDSWSFRKAIAIPSHTSLEANVYVTVPTFDATDTVKFQSDCGDLRFTKQNGELLQYYVVDCDATANIHVFFDSLPAGATTYYMYYGNAAAANGYASADFSTAASGLGTQTLASEEHSDAPIGYWKLDEGAGQTINDSSSGHKNGTLGANSSQAADDPTWLTEDQCISGKCQRFDGVNDYATIGNASDFEITDEMTIEFWMNPQAHTTNYVRPISKGGYLDNGWTIYTDVIGSNVLYPSFGINSGGGWSGAFAPSIPYTLNKWQHIAITVKLGSIGKSYINGKYLGSLVPATYYPTTTRQLRIAAESGGFFKGTIDDVKIYNHVRSDAQIKSDYRSRGSSKGTSVSLSQNSQNDDALSNGLVGYWKMDESSGTAVDSSGNGNTGTWAGTGNHYVTGKFGNGGGLNGTDDNLPIAAGTGSILDITGNQITLSGWVNVNTLTNDYDALFGRNFNSHYRFYLDNTNKVNFQVYTNAATNITSTTALTAGTWYYLTGTYDGSTMKLYINGSEVASSAKTGNINTGTDSFYVGYNSINGTDRYLDGKIDEVRVYNRALSGSEVAKLYAWAPGPVAYYNFDEGAGTTANDGSGNNFAATLVNSPTWGPGKIGKAITTNGSNSYVNLTSGLSLLQTLNQGTVEMWFKTSSDGVLFSITKHDAVSGIMYLLVGDAGVTYNDESMCYGFRDVTSYLNRLVACYRNGTSFLKDNKWHHVAFAVSDSGNRMLIDGKEVALTYTTGTSSTTNYFLNDAGFTMVALGTMPINNGFLYNLAATMDEVKVYNYSRTNSQIIEDMTGGHSVIGAKTPIAYYKFDEGHGTVANNIGSGGSSANLSFAGALYPTWNNNGKFGKGLTFEGTSSRAETASPLLQFPSGQFSISVWINPRTVASAWRRSIISAETYLTNGYRLGIDNGGYPRFWTSQSGGTLTGPVTITPISINTWNHIVVTYNGSTASIYLNGKLEGTSTGTFITGNYTTRVGYLISEYYDGILDELKFYNTALTAEEVKQDYNQNSLISFGGGSDTSALSGGSVASSSASAAYCVPGSSDPCSPPVAEWGFDEGQGTTTDDISGNGNTGTLTNGPTWTRGKIGKVISFIKESNSYTTFANESNFDFSTAFTAEAWVNLSSHDDWGGIISKNSGNTSGWEIRVANTPGQIQCRALNGVDLGTGTTISLNAWHHLACTYSTTDNLIRLYVDGILAASQAGSSGIATNNNQVNVGATGGINSWGITGSIDAPKVYNYARTPSQIAWDYNGGAPVAHYKLNECQGTVANDASGNGNHGAISIGATGTNTAVGTCTSTGAWADGVTGKFGASLDFDGTDDYIRKTSFPYPLHNRFTFSAWVKSTDTSPTQYIIESEYAEPTMWIQSSRLKANLRDPGGSTVSTYTSNTTLSSNVWYHVATTYDVTTGTLNFYVNGKQDGSASHATIGVQAGGVTLDIGGRSTAYFPGLLDDVRIYNYALTQNQIKNLYNENSAIRFGP